MDTSFSLTPKQGPQNFRNPASARRLALLGEGAYSAVYKAAEQSCTPGFGCGIVAGFYKGS